MCTTASAAAHDNAYNPARAPTALAMDFLERDAQETVEIYLAHTIARETLLTRLNASVAFQRL